MVTMHKGLQRILVFVGPDRCGKTQIAQALSRVTGVPYFKATSEHDAYLSSKVTKRELFLNQLRYADPRICDMLKQTGQSVIFDRGFPCEYVYSKVMDRETDTKMLMHLDQEWSNLGAQIIFCYRSSYLGIVDDIDPSITSHKLDALHAEYSDFLHRVTKCRSLSLCVDDEDLVREINDLMQGLGMGSFRP